MSDYTTSDDTSDTSTSTQGISSYKISLIVVFILIFIISIVARIAWCCWRQSKEDKELERKKASEGTSKPGHPPRAGDASLAEQGLASKPELHGTSVGGVKQKMELDSTPVAELDSSGHVRELDGSASVSGGQRGNAARLGRQDSDPDAITPAPEIRTTGVWERWG
ncbi:hypothetical protein F5Y06DRAFT_297693 [Hypoxylon sp. FL0890]|nr:hypothetical protein F5Y06DRAFT_297693 [Hypoxylon sp. FL0890]